MSGLFPDTVFLIPVSVFIAGLIGSPHCVSMCGPIVVNFANSPHTLLFYQLGRLLAYSSLGALLGAFGESLLGSRQSVWVSSFSLLFIAGLLIFNGYRTFQNRPLHFPLPTFVTQASRAVWKSMRPSLWPKSMGGFVAGLLTVLLPCGHLYSFLLGAIATGSAWKGAIFMFAFWLGSAPLLSAGSLWFRNAVARGPVRARRIAGVVLVLAGLFSVLTFGSRTYELYQAKEPAPVSFLENQPPRCH